MVGPRIPLFSDKKSVARFRRLLKTKMPAQSLESIFTQGIIQLPKPSKFSLGVIDSAEFAKVQEKINKSVGRGILLEADYLYINQKVCDIIETDDPETACILLSEIRDYLIDVKKRKIFKAQEVVDTFLSNPKFENDLTAAFNAAGIQLSRMPNPAPVLTLALPDKAPRFWADRPDAERGMNAAAWIRKVYAPWLGQGLARHHVGELDPELGRAYSGWTRKDRHPKDAIAEFAEGNPYGRLDDAEALRRHRANGIESKARSRAAAKMPQL